MFLLSRPTERQIHDLLEAQRDLPLSYPEAGASRNHVPAGYPLNRGEALLGVGEDSYRRGVEALRAWTMYRLPWTRLVGCESPPAPGRVVAAVVSHFGFWSVNPCRVVYAEETGDAGERRFEFAIGTLPDHAERGEERFRVRWWQEDDSVRFDLFSFAAPRHPLVKAAFPLMRMLQRRFAREAAAAVRRAVDSPGAAG